MNSHQGSHHSRPPASGSSKLFKFAEYTSLAASAVGTIASAASQQVIYAAAPLTVSLALNLINRQRFEQQTQHRITTAIAQVDQSLAQLNEQINQIQSQSAAEQNQHIAQLQEQFAAELNRQIAQLQEQSAAELNQRIAELQNQFIVRLDQRIEQSQEQLADSIQQSLQQLTQRLYAIEVQIRQQQFNPSNIDPRTLDIIRQSIQQLFDRITEIESRQSRPPVTPPIEENQRLEELHLNLGIDFGTSFTKVCFRDVARDHSEIVTFTNSPAQVEEALLPTRIGILPDGTLLAGLTASEWQIYEPQVKTTVEFIKMRLAGLDLPQQTGTWRLDQFPELEQPETVENLCAFYLSRVIRRAQNWIRLNKSELIVNQHIVWSANVGVPVAYCDSPALARFEQVLSLAWLLSNEPQTEQLTLERLTQQMQELRSRLASDTPIDCFAVPEIAAEAWSFCNSREVDNGFYVFFDIGDGTIDAAAFYYFREEGEPNVDFYTAQVEPLGVTALSQLLAQELNQSVQDVKAMVCRQSLQTTKIASSQFV